MPIYRATDPAGVVTEYTADVPAPGHLGPGWRLEELVEVTPSPDATDAPPTTVYQGRRVLTKLEFLELFTPAERVAIRQARGAIPALDDYLYMLEQAEAVNLDSPNTQSGLAMLERAGILATGRAQEIMNG